MLVTGGLPSPIRECCAWLRRHGLQVEGIFRIPGSTIRIKKLIQEFNDNPGFELPADTNPHNVSAVMVRWFSGITDDRGKASGIWDHGAYSMKPGIRELRKQNRTSETDGMTASWIRESISHLSADHIAVFKEVSQLLAEASQPENTAHNKMNPDKFALCLLPAIQGVIQRMILHYDDIFQ